MATFGKVTTCKLSLHPTSGVQPSIDGAYLCMQNIGQEVNWRNSSTKEDLKFKRNDSKRRSACTLCHSLTAQIGPTDSKYVKKPIISSWRVEYRHLVSCEVQQWNNPRCRRKSQSNIGHEYSIPYLIHPKKYAPAFLAPSHFFDVSWSNSSTIKDSRLKSNDSMRRSARRVPPLTHSLTHSHRVTQSISRNQTSCSWRTVGMNNILDSIKWFTSSTQIDIN